jgi:DNA-binding transcriptional ArsR family regulator
MISPMPTTEAMLADVDVDAAAAVARLLGDPVRLHVLDYLAREGSAAVTEIAMVLRLSGPRLSNHLAKLRAAGLVTVHRHGRHAQYQVADPSISDVIAGLVAVPVRLGHDAGRPGRAAAAGAGVASKGRAETPEAFRDARSCYDHLAGRLGVEVLRSLQRARALGPAEGDGQSIELRPAAARVFARIGVDTDAVDERRRRAAFACLDSTERAPHLGGAVGAAVLSSLLDRRWLRAEPGSRILSVTPAGRRGLSRDLGVRA